MGLTAIGTPVDTQSPMTDNGSINSAIAAVDAEKFSPNNVSNNAYDDKDEIVIPDYLISQVHSNINDNNSSSNQNKRLSTITTSSYTKKAKRNYVGPWKLGRTLGRGATGRVRLAKHSKTGQLAAVKIIPKSSFNDTKDHKTNGSGIEREIIIMKLISHPNIMALYDVWENKGELYLILEYVEKGELFNYLVKHVRLEEKEAVHYFKQIIAGVNYCHSFNICHRDLKPENLLLDKNHNIKIADFGMAALEVTNKMLSTSCGSPHYASPEVVTGESYHGGPSDIWSCGIILFALLTGHLPFDDEHMTRLLAKVRSGIFRIPSYISAEARDLIKKMLTLNPEKRITIEEILVHPLLQKYPDPVSLSKKDKNYMESPLPKDIMKQPIQPESIDKEILKNLQTLWHGEKKSKIVEKLMTNDENAEKLFYYLLLKYRQEHSAKALHQSNKSKSKKTVVKTTTGETGTDLIKDKKLTMTKSKSIVSTTITDENGNKVTQIVKEPLSKAAKIRSTSYKKLTNSKYSMQKIQSSVSKSSNLNAGAGPTNLTNKRKTRDIDGNLVISASTSFRKGISFHNRAKSSSSFKSFKNTSPYSSTYNIRNYQHLDSAVANDELNKENVPVKVTNKRGSVNYDFNFDTTAKNKRDSGSHSVMTKSYSKRDSFNAFSIGSIPNYAAMIDQIGVPSSSSGKSLTSPKKKQRKSLSSTSNPMLAGSNVASSNSIKRLSNISSRSKRSIMNNSTSKKNIRYPKTKLAKKQNLNFPDLPKLPTSRGSETDSTFSGERKNSASTITDATRSANQRKLKSPKDFGSGLSNEDFAFFCEQLFGFTGGKKSAELAEIPNYGDIEKEYQKRREEQLKEERRKEEEIAASAEKVNELSEKVKLMVLKAQKLEMENQRLLKQQEEQAKEKEKRRVSMPNQENVSPSKEKQKRFASTPLQDHNGSPSKTMASPKSSPIKSLASRIGKSPRGKKHSKPSTPSASPSHSGSPAKSDFADSPTKNKGKDAAATAKQSSLLKTLPSQVTTITSTTTNDEDKFQDAVENISIGRQNTNTSSTFSFNFAASANSLNNKRFSMNSAMSNGSDSRKPIFSFGGINTSSLGVGSAMTSPVIAEESGENKQFTPSAKKFEWTMPNTGTAGFDFKNSNTGVKSFSFDKAGGFKTNAADKKPIVKSGATANNKISSLIPQRDAPKPPQSKAAHLHSTAGGKAVTQTSVKSVVAKNHNVMIKANATTTTTISNSASNPINNTFTPGITVSTPSTITTNTTAVGVIMGENSSKDTTEDAEKSKDLGAKAKLGKLEKSTAEISSVSTNTKSDKEDCADSKASKAPSIDTTTASSILTNPKTKQSWFSKVINNFVPSSAASSSSSEDECKFETFLLLDDVQTLIRNSLALRLKEGSVSKVKFDPNSITTVVPSKLTGSRSLRVKIVINQLRSARSANDYVTNSSGNKILNNKKKTCVIVTREKGPSKAFSKMGQAIQFSIQTEETQFRSRESRLAK